MSPHSAERARIAALIVTHNSAEVVRTAIEALLAGSVVPEAVIVVDNASTDTGYLDKLEHDFPAISIARQSVNTGFCAANNSAWSIAPSSDYVLLLNPDAFVTEHFVRDALERMDDAPSIGALGPKLLGAAASTGLPTGLIDSAGILQSRWGRFFDRGMGAPDRGQYDGPSEDVVALCAAAVVLRSRALEDVAGDGRLFDDRFFMYKEDIDLSFRLRRAGWRTTYDPALVVLHCRGWKTDRRGMPAWARRRSLLNEWRLWARGWTPERSRWASLPYLTAKSVAVVLGR